MLRKVLVVVFIAALMIGLGINQSDIDTTEAAVFISIDYFDGGEVDFTYRGTDDDDGGRDYVMTVWYNANGELVDTDSDSILVGTQGTDGNSCSSVFADDIEPCTFAIYDIDSDVDTNNLATIPEILASPRLYPPAPDQANPQVATISISVAQAQPVYESAGGSVVKVNGADLHLPQDYDGSGSDTHLVMSSVQVDGRTWYELFIGSSDTTVWVPADGVTVVE